MQCSSIVSSSVKSQWNQLGENGQFKSVWTNSAKINTGFQKTPHTDTALNQISNIKFRSTVSELLTGDKIASIIVISFTVAL